MTGGLVNGIYFVYQYSSKAHSIDIHWQTDRIMLVWAYFAVAFQDICRMTNIIGQMLRKGPYVKPAPPSIFSAKLNYIEIKTRDTQSLNLKDRVPGLKPQLPLKLWKGRGHLFSSPLLQMDYQQTCAKQCAPPFSKMGEFLSNWLIHLLCNFFSSA